MGVQCTRRTLVVSSEWERRLLWNIRAKLRLWCSVRSISTNLKRFLLSLAGRGKEEKLCYVPASACSLMGCNRPMESGPLNRVPTRTFFASKVSDNLIKRSSSQIQRAATIQSKLARDSTTSRFENFDVISSRPQDTSEWRVSLNLRGSAIRMIRIPADMGSSCTYSYLPEQNQRNFILGDEPTQAPRLKKRNTLIPKTHDYWLDTSRRTSQTAGRTQFLFKNRTIHDTYDG